MPSPPAFRKSTRNAPSLAAETILSLDRLFTLLEGRKRKKKDPSKGKQRIEATNVPSNGQDVAVFPQPAPPPICHVASQESRSSASQSCHRPQSYETSEATETGAVTETEDATLASAISSRNRGLSAGTATGLLVPPTGREQYVRCIYNFADSPTAGAGLLLRNMIRAAQRNAAMYDSDISTNRQVNGWTDGRSVGRSIGAGLVESLGLLVSRWDRWVDRLVGRSIGQSVEYTERQVSGRMVSAL